MATTRIRESYKIGKNQRLVRYYKPSEYLLVRIIEGFFVYLIFYPIYFVFYAIWWCIKTPIKLIVNLIKKYGKTIINKLHK